jgi:hypothetical protein
LARFRFIQARQRDTKAVILFIPALRATQKQSRAIQKLRLRLFQCVARRKSKVFVYSSAPLDTKAVISFIPARRPTHQQIRGLYQASLCAT